MRKFLSRLTLASLLILAGLAPSFAQSANLATAPPGGQFVPGRAYTLADVAGASLEAPFVYQPTDALAPTFAVAALTVGFTNGSLYPDGHGRVLVSAGTVASLTASKTNCSYPAFASCDIIYSNSSGTVTFSTAIATARAAGNTILAYVETSGTTVTRVTYPYQLSIATFPITGNDIVGVAGAASATASFASQIEDQCAGTVGSAQTEYLSKSSVATSKACSGATTASGGIMIALAGTISNLQVSSSAVVTGGTGKDVLTVLKNGTTSGITCTITGAAATCADTTHTAAVAAGDLLTFQFVTATSDTAANVTVAISKQ